MLLDYVKDLLVEELAVTTNDDFAEAAADKIQHAIQVQVGIVRIVDVAGAVDEAEALPSSCQGNDEWVVGQVALAAEV